MPNFYNHLHHAKKRLKHPEIKGIIILAVLTLIIPLLVIILSQPTQIKQEASMQRIAAGTTQCETNGDVCTPGNYVAMSGGKCSNGQSPLSFTCNAGYVCCRPGVSFPNGQGGNKCGGCQGQVCPNAGQYCEQPTTQKNQFGIYLCNQTNGIWQFQYNQTGSNTCTWNSPSTGGSAPIVTGNDTCTPSGGICVKSGVTCSSLTTATNPGRYIAATDPALHCPTGNGQSCCMPGGSTPGVWQCNKNYQCANTVTGQVDNTKCTPKCTPPPPTCTCDHDGYGAPLNHFTCKDYTGKVVKDDYCTSNEICDAKTGWPRPCKTPTISVCTCQNPGKYNLFAIGGWINPQNGYTCTGKTPNQVHYCSQNDECGAYNASNPTQLLPGSGKSNAPQSPCNAGGNIPQATANAITSEASLIGVNNPYVSVQLTYDFISQSGQAQSTQEMFANSKVLAAQIFKATDTLKYDPTTKTYKNRNFNIDKIPPGQYLVFAKVDGFLAAQVENFNGEKLITIAQDKIFDPQKVTLSPGDLAPNPHGDNFVDLNDYNALISCYAQPATGTCKLADLNNDGKIDDNDFQLLIGNFEKFGDSYTEPNFTCTQDPACQSGTSSIQLCSLKCIKNIDF
jgi:hypothetical protein